MSKPKFIKDWEELSNEISPTHTLQINDGCGWILSNEHDFKHYLSTHTFYDGFNEQYTEILQSCGFNVELANWDKLGY